MKTLNSWCVGMQCSTMTFSVQRQEKLQESRHLKSSVHGEVQTGEALVDDPPKSKGVSDENLR